MARSVQVPAHKVLRILATLLTCCASYPRRGMPTTIAVALTRPGWPGERRDTLIQVVIEVRSGAASFRVSVRAHSIQRAISLVRDSYPGVEAGLVLPVEPESFFSGDDFDGAQQDTFQRPERLVG
jgi:hypothetical protein